MRVVLQGLGDGAVRLAEGPLRRGGEISQLAAQRAHEKRVRLLVEHERPGLAARTDDPARTRGEAAEMLAFAT